MSYFLRSELEAKVPASIILQALDDDADGVEDVGNWDLLVADVQRQIDGRLEAQFAVPLAEPLPQVIREAAVILAAETIFLRRGKGGDDNPWVNQANAMRARLEKIGAGDLPMTYHDVPDASAGTVITEPSRMSTDPGLHLV